MTEFVLFGGKGGVGKTTLAAATAVKLAEEGHRTLIVSTDPAHSVADAVGAPVGTQPTRVLQDRALYAMEVDPRERFQDRYGDLFEDLLDRIQSLGVDLDSSDVTDVSDRGLLPGADEVAVVDLFAEYMSQSQWDRIVFDTAPSGHTLRLLELPDVMNTTVGKLLSVQERLGSVAGSVRSLLGGSGNEGGGYAAKAGELQDAMRRVKVKLRDPEQTAFQVVTLPETMALAETDRLLERLEEVGVPIEGVLVNRILQEPPEDCPNCTPRYERQRAQIAEARADIDQPVTEIPLVVDRTGIDRVEVLSRAVPEISH
jgi:arsenite-transporting ATPase